MPEKAKLFPDPRIADRVAANPMETDLRSGEDAVQTRSPRTEAIYLLRQVPQQAQGIDLAALVSAGLAFMSAKQ
jgi:hypothetical protein